MKTTIKLMVFLFLLTTVTAQCDYQEPQLNGIIKDIIQFEDGQICTDCTCNITIIDAQNNFLVINQSMTYDTTNQFYYYTISDSIFFSNQTYTGSYICANANGIGASCIDFMPITGLGPVDGITAAIGDLQTTTEESLIDRLTRIFGFENLVSGAEDWGKVVIIGLAWIGTIIDTVIKVSFVILGVIALNLVKFVQNPVQSINEDIIPYIYGLVWTLILSNLFLFTIIEMAIFGLSINRMGKVPLIERPIVIGQKILQYNISIVMFLGSAFGFFITIVEKIGQAITAFISMIRQMSPI